ncbi:hypothetical protein [Teichococcus rhizosphaerae]|uniref:hypothetical protein n=1 Tax=Teichococcus rhizosphaerae TaxID=1335062 RepID=UPI001145AC44|nr:hypothetical protein [Pseudoroseomonas rhizosphaerae]
MALLGAVRFWPTPGQPVAILFGAGLAPEQALLLTSEGGHRPMRLLRAAPPVVLAVLEAAHPLPPRAWLALAAGGGAGCAPGRKAATPWT